MHDRHDDLKLGVRVRALGLWRSPRLNTYTGVIVGMSPHTASIRVLIVDGKRRSRCI